MPSLSPPPIEPVTGVAKRPLWSVMIPTYHCASYLRETLSSVLAQDRGKEKMQIEVVDDASTEDSPEAVVEELGRGRVAFYRQPRNVGAIRNFNSCVRRSTGSLVHILHGDDFVYPGFYEQLESAFEKNPDVALICARVQTIRKDGTPLTLSNPIAPIERPSRDFSSLLYVNPFRTPSVVIRRSLYEASGGFMESLVHTADWEMFIRAIADGGGYAIDVPLAAHRSYDENDTSRLMRTGENLRDELRVADIFASRYPAFDRKRFKRTVNREALFQALFFRRLGQREASSANWRVWRETLDLHTAAGYLGRLLLGRKTAL